VSIDPDEPRASLGLELQLFAVFRAASAAEKLATIIDSIEFVRPVTPKVAGSSPVAPAISIKELVRVGYFGCSFLAARSCNFLL